MFSLSTSDRVWSDRAADLRRFAVLSLVSIPVAAEMVFGEVLFVGHIVLLVEALGLAWGLVVFTIIWAALGLAVLTAADVLWPRLKPSIVRLRARSGDLLAGVPARLLLAYLGAAAVAAGALFFGVRLAGWLDDHPGDVAGFIVAAAVVLAVLLLMSRVGRGLERWVRTVAGSAGPATHALAIILIMIVLGPAFGWFLFRILGYTRRAIYTLTLLSAPPFAAVWVPVYALGVWSLLERLF